MRKFLAVLVFLLSASTASAQHERERPNTAMVVVENHNWSDVVVYAVRGGMKVRLGMVAAVHTGTFYVPPTMMTDGAMVRLYVRPIGGPSRGAAFYQSEAVPVMRDEKAVLTLDGDLSRSFIAVYVR